MKVNLISLGCPKNLVDSENILGALGAAGASLTTSPDDCDIIILNTCAFIKPALEETEEEIVKALQSLRNGKKLYVVGCAVNRYGALLKHKYPEVSGWHTISEIPGLISTLLPDAANLQARLPTTAGYAYMKISEGCSNNCAYCTIPAIKGAYRSFAMDKLLAEGRELAELGIKELILIGQDTTRYGTDIYGQPMLKSLLRGLVEIRGIDWLRIMYAHPKTIDSRVIEEIELSKKICKYIDLPIQHISPRILKMMKRGTSRERLESVIKTLLTIPDISIRTTIIIGFPGETDAEFDELMEFVGSGYFDWLGVFPYYCEAGTIAAELKQLPDDLIGERYQTALSLQQHLIERKQRARCGHDYKVLLHSSGDRCVGHAEFCAPEVDGQIHVEGQNLKAGRFYDVRMTGMKGSDLRGEIIEEMRS